MTRLLILGVVGAAFMAAGCGGSIAAARSMEATTPAAPSAIGGSPSMITRSAPTAPVSVAKTSSRAAVSATPGVVGTTSRSRPSKPHPTSPPTSGPRNRLIGLGIDVGVSIYSDCTGRAELTRGTVAIDTCMTWDVYFVGHSYGGPFAGLTYARNGEILTWYNAVGVARHYAIKGHQFTYGYGPPDMPPPGTTAQFQTCLTPNGSRIITFYAVSP